MVIPSVLFKTTFSALAWPSCILLKFLSVSERSGLTAVFEGCVVFSTS